METGGPASRMSVAGTRSRPRPRSLRRGRFAERRRSSERLRHVVEQRRQPALVARVRRQVRRHNQLMLAVHRHLRVVALLEPFTPRLHDPALRVGEVARLIRRIAPTVPLVRGVERRQVQAVHQIADVVRQVALRQPRPHVWRQQQRLVRGVAAKSRRHQVLPESDLAYDRRIVFLRRRLLEGARQRQSSFRHSEGNRPDTGFLAGTADTRIPAGRPGFVRIDSIQKKRAAPAAT